jgi:hypothetical protein
MARGRAQCVLTVGSIMALALSACASTTATSPATSPLSVASPSGSARASAAPDASVQASPAPDASGPPELAGRLLFSRFTEATHTFDGTFTSAPNGTAEQSVPMPGPEGGGRWSRSGSEIAVMTILPDNRVGTAIIAADGTVLRTLEIPDPSLNLVCTVWSPDDARLACEGWDDADASRNGIYALSSADGSDLVRLTEPPDGMADIAGDVSIDGQVIFKRYPGGEAPGALWLVPLTGGAPVEMASGAYEDPGRFDPEGQLIATSAGGQIVIVDRDGAQVHRVDNRSRFEFGPDWSPDGEWIVFSGSAGAFVADLFISHADGTGRFLVAGTPDNEIVVDWGP